VGAACSARYLQFDSSGREVIVLEKNLIAGVEVRTRVKVRTYFIPVTFCSRLSFSATVTAELLAYCGTCGVCYITLSFSAEIPAEEAASAAIAAE